MITNDYSIQKEEQVLEENFCIRNQTIKELSSAIKVLQIGISVYYERCLIFILKGLGVGRFGETD
jgi:hypothetical protein